MTSSLYSIFCIVVRLGAMLLFVTILSSFPLALLAAQGELYGTGAPAMVIGISIALLALAVLLWLYPGAIARLAINRASREVFESSIRASELQHVAFAVLGVAFAMDAIIELVTVVLRIVLAAQVSEFPVSALIRNDGVRLVSLILKFVLGIGLALGARGLAGCLERLRYGNSPEVESDLPPGAIRRLEE